MPERYIVTSALPYINGVKHLGNLIGSLLPADIYARYRRQQGDDVLCVCGTDEHGTPSEIAAINEGLPVREFATKYYEIQKGIYERFRLSFDYFGRTSSSQNHQMTQHIFLCLCKNGLIKERVIKQLYCEDDARFLPDRFVEGTCPKCGYDHARGDQCESCTSLLDPDDLIAPRSAISGSTNIAAKESDHLFLDLPKLADRISSWLDTRQDWPKTTMSIARKWLDEGLRERCITRDLEWGVPVPMDGYENKVFYVWFDAPIGYIGISMEWAASIGEEDRWQEYWKNPDTHLVQFMAKDNVPFHTVTWPTTMMGADDGFVLAEMVKGFEWLNYEDGKFSTSQNRGVFTDDALALYPSDYWRYYLVLVAPEKGDSDFKWDGFMDAVNKDMADTLGNFVLRSLSFVRRYFDGTVPAQTTPSDLDREMISRLNVHVEEARQNLETCQFQKTIRAQRALWADCNWYFDGKEPWAQRKTDLEAAGTTLGLAANLCRSIAILAAPFIPDTADKIAAQLNLDEDIHALPWTAALETDVITGTKISDDSKPLVTKIEAEDMEKLRERYAGSGEE